MYHDLRWSWRLGQVGPEPGGSTGRHAAWGWGWNQKKDKHDENLLVFFWWLEGVRISSFFSHGWQNEIMDCTAFRKKTPQADVCVRVQMAAHTNDMVSIHTHYIWCLHIYIYVHVHANKKGYILYITSIKIVEHAPRRTANFSPDGGGTWFSWSLTLIQKSGEETTFWIHKTLENNGINCQPQLAKLLKDI